ncbi:MAG: energy transducer TonB [Candidatus Omnitrophica bacterium]|nr:energy transducer TonB [Candidatus Omnitrophota bacterium]
MSKEFIIGSILSVSIHAGALCAFTWSNLSFTDPSTAVERAPSAIEISMTVYESLPVARSEAPRQLGSREFKDRKKEPRSANREKSDLSNSRVGAVTKEVFTSPIVNIPPAYPVRSREDGEEGLVVLEVEILADGRVGEVAVTQSSGYTRLDRAARSAIKQWRFLPARVNGIAVPVKRRLPVIFTLAEVA